MIVEREFTLLYIILDSIFLIFFLGILVFKKKYFAILFSLFGGILYFIVDYGIFHLICHSRYIENGSLFWTLLWMSLSYGITNFALIYFFVIKDKNVFSYAGLIWIWWICCPLLAKMGDGKLIHISRTTSEYHNVMAILLLVGYFGLIIYNLFLKDKRYKAPTLKLFIIGFIVQFGWEFSLLIGGIRSTSYTSLGDQILLMLNNSLLETNLGMPYLWLIILALRSWVDEDLTMYEDGLSLKEMIKNNNEIKYLDLLK